MAKLSARGRTELARYRREYTVELEPEVGQRDYDTVKRRIDYVFMSDGNVLKQVKTWWRDGQSNLGPYKKVKDLSVGSIPSSYSVSSFPVLYARLESKGYTKQ